MINSKPFKVTVDGKPATTLRHDKQKPRAMRIREKKHGLRRDVK